MVEKTATRSFPLQRGPRGGTPLLCKRADEDGALAATFEQVVKLPEAERRASGAKRE